jgi:hypothetical protein
VILEIGEQEMPVLRLFDVPDREIAEIRAVDAFEDSLPGLGMKFFVFLHLRGLEADHHGVALWRGGLTACERQDEGEQCDFQSLDGVVFWFSGSKVSVRFSGDP